MIRSITWRGLLVGALLLHLLCGQATEAAPPPAPAATEKCPVCGMFVAKYPDWAASVVFKDGSISYCDGVKDVRRLLLEPARFGARQGLAEMAQVWVRDYYTLQPIDAATAFYVVGSDVFGPMGKELIPFAQRADAEEFLRDHHGERVVAFAAIDLALLATLE